MDLGNGNTLYPTFSRLGGKKLCKDMIFLRPDCYSDGGRNLKSKGRIRFLSFQRNVGHGLENAGLEQTFEADCLRRKRNSNRECKRDSFSTGYENV